MHYFHNRHLTVVQGPMAHKVSPARVARIFVPVAVSAAAIAFIFGTQLSLAYFNKWTLCSVFAGSGFFLIQVREKNGMASLNARKNIEIAYFLA